MEETHESIVLEMFIWELLLLWTEGLVTDRSVFAFGRLTADEMVTGRPSTKAFISLEVIVEFSCMACNEANALFVWKTVGVGNPTQNKDNIENGFSRFTTWTAHSLVTIRGESAAFDEFDCELTFINEMNWFNNTTADILIDGTDVDVRLAAMSLARRRPRTFSLNNQRPYRRFKAPVQRMSLC